MTLGASTRLIIFWENLEGSILKQSFIIEREIFKLVNVSDIMIWYLDYKIGEKSFTGHLKDSIKFITTDCGWIIIYHLS